MVRHKLLISLALRICFTSSLLWSPLLEVKAHKVLVAPPLTIHSWFHMYYHHAATYTKLQMLKYNVAHQGSITHACHFICCTFRPYQFDFMFLGSGGSRFCELGRKNLIKPVNSTWGLRQSHLNCWMQQTEYCTILSYRTTVYTATTCRTTACTWSYSSETKKSTSVVSLNGNHTPLLRLFLFFCPPPGSMYSPYVSEKHKIKLVWPYYYRSMAHIRT